jgi:hypothetical protein
MDASLKKQFIELINDFCALSAMADSQHILNGGSIVINDVVFSLLHKERLDPRLLFLRCDFGELSDKRRADAYKALLELNLYLYDGAGPAFSIGPKTGRVLFTNSYRLEGLEASQLHQILAELAEQVLEWRGHCFLEPPSKARTHGLVKQFVSKSTGG